MSKSTKEELTSRFIVLCANEGTYAREHGFTMTQKEREENKAILSLIESSDKRPTVTMKEINRSWDNLRLGVYNPGAHTWEVWDENAYILWLRSIGVNVEEEK